MAISQGLIIEKILLYTHRRSSEQNALDLTEYYSGLEIIEDIFSSSIYARLTLKEIHNIVSSPIDRAYTPGPIIGNETIEIQLSERRNNSRFRLFMKVYNISSRMLVNTKAQVTILDLVSNEFILNSQMKLSKSYVDWYYSDIVEDILVNDIWKGVIPPETSYDFEPTDTKKNIILPYWRPFEAINWISSRSISSQYPAGASYLFFETINNHRKRLKRTFHFKTLEYLYDNRTRKILETSIANIVPVEQHSQDYERINQYDFNHSFNLLDNMQAGMYANKLIQHDILYKTFETTVFNYDLEYSSNKHCENNQGKGRLISRLTRPFCYSPDQNTVLYVKNKSMYSGTGQDDSMKTWILKRKTQIQQLMNSKIRVVIPADSSISVGDLMDVRITSPKDSPDISENKDLSFDKYYREKYLVTGVKHNITTEAPSDGLYSMTLELCKDTLFVNPLTENQLPGRRQ